MQSLKTELEDIANTTFSILALCELSLDDLLQGIPYEQDKAIRASNGIKASEVLSGVIYAIRDVRFNLEEVLKQI